MRPVSSMLWVLPVLLTCAAAVLPGCTREVSAVDAARTGNVAELTRALNDVDERGQPANANAGDAEGNTLLHIAAQAGQLGIVKTLIVHHSADPNVTNEHGQTPLNVARMAHHSKVAGVLRCQLVCEAARKGDQQALLRLLGSGASANCWSATGRQPIHYAADGGDPETIALLAEQGADLDAVSTPYYGYDTRRHGPWLRGETPLIIAAMGEDVRAVEQLLSLGASPNQRAGGGMTALHYSVEYSRTRDVLRRLLEGGASVDARDDLGRTPLYYFACNHHASADVLHDLLANGANVNAVDDAGNSALHQAAYFPELGPSRMLVDAGANINARNKKEETPLVLAASVENVNFALFIIARGAETGIPNKDGQTVRSIARGKLPELLNALPN